VGVLFFSIIIIICYFVLPLLFELEPSCFYGQSNQSLLIWTTVKPEGRELAGFRSDACARLECLCVLEALSAPLCSRSPWYRNHSVSQQPCGLAFAYSTIILSFFLAVHKSAGCGCTTHRRLPTEVEARWRRAVACWWMYGCAL